MLFKNFQWGNKCIEKFFLVIGKAGEAGSHVAFAYIFYWWRGVQEIIYCAVKSQDILWILNQKVVFVLIKVIRYNIQFCIVKL